MSSAIMSCIVLLVIAVLIGQSSSCRTLHADDRFALKLGCSNKNRTHFDIALGKHETFTPYNFSIVFCLAKSQKTQVKLYKTLNRTLNQVIRQQCNGDHTLSCFATGPYNEELVGTCEEWHSLAGFKGFRCPTLEANVVRVGFPGGVAAKVKNYTLWIDRDCAPRDARFGPLKVSSKAPNVDPFASVGIFLATALLLL